MEIQNGIATEKFILQSRDIDRHSTCNVDTYFHYMQDVAGLHAVQLGIAIDDLNERGRTWMVNRTRMKIHRYATWPCELSIETWPQSPQKFYCPRGCRGYDGKNLLFESMTRWLIIDLKNGRIAKPETEDFEKLSLSGREYPLAMDSKLTFLPETYKEITSSKLTIRYKDTDTNGHVNNVAFVQWLLESLPFPFLESNSATDMDITYLKEAFDHDSLVCQTGFRKEGDLTSLHHQIVKEVDGEQIPLCIAHSLWKPGTLS